MKLCVLVSAADNSDAPFVPYDTAFCPEPFLAGHEWEIHALDRRTAVREVGRLARQGFDLFLNFCDGAWEEDRAGIEVVEALERLNVPYTGATPEFYEPSRETMKRVCRYYGIGAPNGATVRTPEEAEQAARFLRFPLIVKHPNSYSSIGLTAASRVTTVEQLREQAAAMIETFGAALVEEFVEGREFTALVVENAADPARPFVYDPVEFVFPEGETFKHFDLKWIDYGAMHAVPCADARLAERIKTAAALFFVGLRGAGYGRCDLRVDAAGEIFMLEMNPQGGVFYALADPGSADLVLMQHEGGHADFMHRLIDAGLARHRRKQRNWTIRPRVSGGHEMVAVRAIAPGEVIERYEEQPHVLVSRRHVAEHWDARHRDWFARYAYPLTDEVWVMWEADPAAWKPINHSCDPSAWLDGLDMVARRPIAAGEQITLDYATFCHESMPEFECACGAANCRGVVRGSDCLLPLVEGYGEHVSDWVRGRRAALDGGPGA